MRPLTGIHTCFCTGLTLALLSASPSAQETLFLTETAPSTSAYLEDFGVQPPRQNTGVPAGFEALMLEQTTLVDVYFAGRYVVSTLGSFTPVTVSFDSPQDIVELIPTLIDPQAVLAALEGDLDTNSEMRCYARQQSGCGLLEPAVAEVIFNTDTYRADLFVNPALLAVHSSVVQKYLGPSSAGFSYFQTFNSALTRSGSDSLASINARSIFSLGETSLEVLSDYSSNAAVNVSAMNLQRDWQGQRYQAGFVTTNASNLKFSRNADILGFRMGSTLDTREDLRQTSGNTIAVFLPRRSRVSLFKDGRLITSALYEPGNQELDTRSLPGGAYDVEIVITDGAGERRETRFYSKSNRIPPADQPLYFIEAGRLTDRSDQTLPEVTSTDLWRTGMTRRIGSNSSLTLGLSGNRATRMFEAGWFGVYRRFETAFDLALTDDNDLGYSVSLRIPLLASQLLIDHREVRRSEPAALIADDLLGAELRQSSISTTLPLGGRAVTLGARYNSRGAEGTERNFSALYNLWDGRFGRSALRSSVQWVRQNGDDIFLLTVGLYVIGDHLTFNVDSDYDHRETDSGSEALVRGRTSLAYRNDPSDPTQFEARLTSRHQSDTQILGGEVETRGTFGRLRAQVERNFAVDGAGTLYAGNYSTSLAATTDGFAFGGMELNRSAIIVDLASSEAERNHFDVIVNNTSVATALPGKRTVVPLTPYSVYSVGLRARGAGFVSFTDRTHQVTLYPGNAVNLEWQADSVVIVFGDISDEHGEPLGNALIHGVSGLATTDELGQFQAEISPNTETIRFETIDQECTVTLGEFEVEDGIAFLPPLSCVLVQK